MQPAWLSKPAAPRVPRSQVTPARLSRRKLSQVRRARRSLGAWRQERACARADTEASLAGRHVPREHRARHTQTTLARLARPSRLRTRFCTLSRPISRPRDARWAKARAHAPAFAPAGAHAALQLTFPQLCRTRAARTRLLHAPDRAGGHTWAAWRCVLARPTPCRLRRGGWWARERGASSVCLRLCCLLGISAAWSARLAHPACWCAPPARSRGHGSAWGWPSPQKAYSGGDLTPEVGPESGAEGALSAPEEERKTPHARRPHLPNPASW